MKAVAFLAILLLASVTNAQKGVNVDVQVTKPTVQVPQVQLPTFGKGAATANVEAPNFQLLNTGKGTATATAVSKPTVAVATPTISKPTVAVATTDSTGKGNGSILSSITSVFSGLGKGKSSKASPAFALTVAKPAVEIPKLQLPTFGKGGAAAAVPVKATSTISIGKDAAAATPAAKPAEAKPAEATAEGTKAAAVDVIVEAPKATAAVEAKAEATKTTDVKFETSKVTFAQATPAASTGKGKGAITSVISSITAGKSAAVSSLQKAVPTTTSGKGVSVSISGTGKSRKML